MEQYDLAHRSCTPLNLLNTGLKSVKSGSLRSSDACELLTAEVSLVH
jgi:hypothetical protein